MEIRINKAMIELNIGFNTIVRFLNSVPGLVLESELTPNTKLSDAQYEALQKNFAIDKAKNKKTKEIIFERTKSKGGHKESTKKPITNHLIQQSEIRSMELTESPINSEVSEQKEGVMDHNDTELISVSLSQLHFGEHYISYHSKKGTFVYYDKRFPSCRKSHKKLSSIRNVIAEIVLNHSDHSFRFTSQSILDMLTNLSRKADDGMIQQSTTKIEKAKSPQPVKPKPMPITKHNTSFSNLQIGEGLVMLKYKKNIYIHKDNKIKNLNRILSLYYKSLSKKQVSRFKASVIKVAINEDSHTFEFVDFDLYEFVMDKIKGSYKSANFIRMVQKEQELPQMSTIMTTKLDIDNIEFFDGYYIVALTKEENKNKSIAPLKVNDGHSFACLRHVHRYFSDRFPQNITIKYNNEKIIGLKPMYILSQYIRTLYGNMNEHGEWWEEVQNERKPSLSTCRTTSAAVVKKKVSLRSGYLDNLASMQNEKKLIPVYEINHGNREDAFIFSIGMSANRCAIIFENVSTDASTATEVFIAKDENYESCINLIFDYFTDYTISTKRDSLRKGVNSPNKFKAEKFYSVAHGELETWLVKINQILEHTPLPSRIEFKSGLHVPHDIETRSGNGRITPKNIHNELMRNLYSQLCKEYGTDNVGTEIRIGTKRIDAVAKTSSCYDIYEIKSDPNPFSCVTLALGQICQYAYLYCRDKIGKMVIVGTTAASPEVEQYLSWFRKKHLMEVYYLQITI